MKILTLMLILTVTVCCAVTDEQIADAIYIAEGGTRARVPYGILSVKVRNVADARRVCLNTIRNNRARWIKAGSPGSFINFLADRYCPPSVDPVGNLNWKRNVSSLSNRSNRKQTKS